MVNLLFESDIKRLNLLKIKSKPNNQKIKIALYRNHSFETISSILNAFLDFSDITADFKYSDYDDSLNFQIIESDLNIIWIDAQRYKNINLNAFLTERLTFLKRNSSAPILLIYIKDGAELNINIDTLTDCYIINGNEIIKSLDKEAYDYEKESYSGTRLSNKASIMIAQKLGLQIIPSIFKQPIKALVFDLDNTLYKGILGEDGIKGIELTKEHILLQNHIKTLKNQGYFICLASKNDEDDVKNLFLERKDFPLKYEDFTAVKINWNNKADNIIELAKMMNIGLDSILFIDDNPAEIQNIETSAIPVKTILAQSPSSVIKTISLYPGLFKLKKSYEDNIRSNDIKANIQRMELAKNLTTEEYFKKLKIELIYSVNDEKQIPRIAELFNKTNQFIFSYKRYRETEVREIMNDKNSVIITVKMSDILSDSGIIAIVCAHKNNNILIIDELTVSCRALGRNLEDVMLPKLFQLAKDYLNTSNITRINYKRGPRNTPALKWLENISKETTSQEGTIQYNIPKEINTSGLKIVINNI